VGPVLSLVVHARDGVHSAESALGGMPHHLLCNQLLVIDNVGH